MLVCLLCAFISDTHVLVQFQDEDTSAIVPIKRLKRKDCLKIGEECKVTWSDKKIYSGLVVFSGMSWVTRRMSFF